MFPILPPSQITSPVVRRTVNKVMDSLGKPTIQPPSLSVHRAEIMFVPSLAKLDQLLQVSGKTRDI